MDLHSLGNSSGARTRRMRIGRGMGSGKGKTCGKGHKGQMSRKGHKHKAGFEGGQMRLIRRIPKRGFTNPTRELRECVNVGALSVFEEGSEVTAATLKERGLAGRRGLKVKILGQGELANKLVVKVAAFSASAREKIEAVGGTCEVIGS